MCSIMFAIKVFCESLSYDRNANVWISASLIALFLLISATIEGCFFMKQLYCLMNTTQCLEYLTWFCQQCEQ